MPLKKLLIAVAAVASLTTTVHAVPVTGLRGVNTLFDFDTANPTAVNSRAIVGVAGTLVAIDYRPATGVLYGLTGAGSLYTINVTTGAAALASMLSVALSGTDFDIAFNPTVDRLRIVSTNGQNLRVNVDTGATTVDGTLNVGGTTKTGIIGAAYTNQFAGATTTTLYDLDSATTQALFTQAPPNDGTLATVGSTGFFGISSFDIDGLTNIGYVAGNSGFGSINLATGQATFIGGFGITDDVDFAIAPRAAAVPEPLPLALLGVGAAGAFVARRKRRPAA